ncbi:MAG TPA: hypothetical protein VG826_16175 [Pirellulales bacterium]|nr:hypothetical protein [Pirellulales bacterium]
MPGTSTNPRTAALVVASVVAISTFAAWFFWPARPPQLSNDREVFDTVDALFTAVRSRDDGLLDNCQQRLHGFENDGKLSADAARYLDNVLDMARNGKRRPAAEKLYEFMKAQRRTS